MISFKVDRNLGGQRLDRLMRKVFDEESLSKIFGAIRKKNVKVNGKTVKGNHRVEDGDEVKVYDDLQLSKRMAASLAPKKTTSVDEYANKKGWNAQSISSQREQVDNAKYLKVAFENDDYIVMNKPSGTPSQPGSGQAVGSSLVEQLWSYLGDNDAYFRPALAHRLDKDTSGLIVGAKNADTLRELNEIVRKKKMYKEYTALVKGSLKKSEGSIRLQMERVDSKKGAKMQVRDNKSEKSKVKLLDSTTHYKVLAEFPGFSLVKIVLETGRMHQIRTHFAHIGHPLAGDSRYGDFNFNRELKKEIGLKRLFLHASRLEWPWKNGVMKHKLELSSELEQVLEKIKSKS